VRLSTSSVGAALRQERIRQRLSLETIASRTRISQRFLQAIEVEDFESLPGLVFARNFVRQYASSLGMEAEPLLAALPKVNLESVPLPNPAYYANPRRRDSRWAAAISSAMWVVFAAGTLTGGYIYLNQKQPLTTTAPTPTQVTESVGGARLNDAPSNAIPAAAAPAALTPDTPKPDSPKPDTPNRSVQVILKAREASWVQITADGKNAFTGILNPNDSRAIDADALIKVTAGNAGGVEISLNGKSLDPLGASGQVRTIRLTSEGPQLPAKTIQTPSSEL
jgi:cytoskeletal protein RodZ